MKFCQRYGLPFTIFAIRCYIGWKLATSSIYFDEYVVSKLLTHTLTTGIFLIIVGLGTRICLVILMCLRLFTFFDQFIVILLIMIGAHVISVDFLILNRQRKKRI